MKPMQYEECGPDQFEVLMDSDQWVAEQKLDGVRLMPEIDPQGNVTYGGVTFAAAAQWFPALTEALWGCPAGVLDGELMIETGELWLFDVPYLAGFTKPGMALWERRALLETLVKALDNPLIKITPQARTSVEKRQLWESVSDGRHEGIVLKRRDAPYCEGRTKNVLKVKHVKTIDCVVMELGRGGANNAVLGLFRNGGLVEVGQCSMIGKPACVVGEVVEIHCLYATSSHRLYQPRLVRLRPDRTAESCEWRQVEGIVTNRAVVGA